MAHDATASRSASEDSAGAYATWLPRDIPYNAAFESSIASAFLTPPSPHSAPGILVLPPDSNEAPRAGASVRARDIDPTTLPVIPFRSLPIPLDDPRRVYASPIPGVRLTHPSGYLEGGPGFSPADDVFAADFVARFKVRNGEALRRVVERELDGHRVAARERAAKRQEAVERNQRVEKELKTLQDEMDLEIKVLSRMREEARERREKRALRKHQRELKGRSMTEVMGVA